MKDKLFLGIYSVIAIMFLFLVLFLPRIAKSPNKEVFSEQKIKLLYQSRDNKGYLRISVWCDTEKGHLIYDSAGGGVAVIVDGCK